MEKLFDWYFERHKLVIEVTAVSVGAFFAALIVAALKGDYANNWTFVAIVALGVVLLAGSLIGRSYLLMVKMEDDLVGALKLLKLITGQ